MYIICDSMCCSVFILYPLVYCTLHVGDSMCMLYVRLYVYYMQ